MKYLGLPGPNPCLVDRFPESRRPRYIPPEEDFWRAYETVQGQDRVMLTAALYLVARRSELFRLTWSDVDFGQSRIRLYTRKQMEGTLEYDWLPMAEELQQALEWWWDNRTFRQAIHVFLCEYTSPLTQEYYGQPFKARRRFMPNLCKRAGVKPFGFHAIRHLTASILYKQGMTLSVIQAVLRHRSSNTTTEYLRSLGLEDIRPALDGLTGNRARVLEFRHKQKPAETSILTGVSEKSEKTVYKDVNR